LQRTLFTCTRGWWVVLAVLAVCTATFAGGQKFALCISAAGHLDLKHPADSCHGCPVAACQRDALPLPAETDDTSPSLPRTCCVDIPLMYDLVGWLAPRGLDDGQDLAGPAFAATVAAPVAAGLTASARGGPTREPACGRQPDHLAALASVILLC
jgi:hypothetical protein